MAYCVKCHRDEANLIIGSKTGLCIDCLESEHEALTQMIEMLKNGGDDRKAAIAALDEAKMADVTAKASVDLKDSPFSVWDDSIHMQPSQLGNIRRSKSVKILSYDAGSKTAIVAGSKGHTYETSFDRCDCGNFISKHLPCKHMYRLAAEFGGVDFSKYL